MRFGCSFVVQRFRQPALPEHEPSRSERSRAAQLLRCQDVELGPFHHLPVDPKKRADATPAEPLQPPVKGYPPPPPNALPTTGLTSSQATIHYNQPIVLQCLNTAVVSPVMVVRKVEKGTNVLGGASAGPTESIAREAFGDPVSQLHKIALEVLEDPTASVPRPTGESGESMSPGHSGPFLACLNESVGMHRPSEPRKWVGNSGLSVPSTPTTPVTSMNLAAIEAGDIPSGYLPTSPTSAAAYAAAQTRYSLGAGRGGSMMSPSASSSSHDVSSHGATALFGWRQSQTPSSGFVFSGCTEGTCRSSSCQ